MHVWAIGLNHRSAALDLRERFALDAARIGDALRGLREALAVPAEAALPLYVRDKVALTTAERQAAAAGGA